MSDAFKAVKSFGKKAGRLATKVLGTAAGFVVGGPIGAVAGYKVGSSLSKKLPGGGGDVQETGGVPTVDTAAQNQAALSRIRMRKGVLANIYGGSSNAAPSVGTKSLMGQ